MVHAKILAFFHEFPFLAELVNPNCLASCKVKRVDLNLLAVEPSWFSYDSIFLLNASGKKLAEVGVIGMGRRWYRLWRHGKVRRCETVGGCIARLPNPGAVAMIVTIDWWLDMSLTIYKPPRNFTIEAWLDASPELVAVRAEVAAIDTITNTE